MFVQEQIIELSLGHGLACAPLGLGPDAKINIRATRGANRAAKACGIGCLVIIVIGVIIGLTTSKKDSSSKITGQWVPSIVTVNSCTASKCALICAR